MPDKKIYSDLLGMTDTETKFGVFLSCSPEDNRALRSDTPTVDRQCWGDWLQTALTTFAVPAEFVGQINGRGEIIPERIAPIFRDEAELSAGGTLSAEVRQTLEQSVCLIVVCSPRSAQSHQVNETVRYFNQLGRGRQILPLVIAGEPHASESNQSDGSAECFVPALRHPVLPDGTLDTTRRSGKSIFVDARHGAEKREILAADHRSAEADLEMAKVQLIALLLGVGFNGLWWREQKRHFFDLAEARHQVAEARRQLQAAKQQALENQNLPRDVEGQIKAAQKQASEAQSQAHAAQQQLQEFQNKVRDTQAQLEDARQRVRAAESKVLEAQQQVRAGENKVLEIQNLPPVVSSQTPEVQALQSQLAAARQQAQVTEEKFLAAQLQIHEFQNQVLPAENQARVALDRVQEIQNQGRNARRLTKVFALLAVLALLATGEALRQRRVVSQALATATVEAAGKFEWAPGDAEPIQRVLQKIDGAEQAENRRRSLDQLAAEISAAEIPGALAASAVMADDPLRRYFQLAVLNNWLKADLPGAIHWVYQLPDSETKNQALEACLDELAKTDMPGALALAESLPTGAQRSALLAQLWLKAEPFTAWEWLNCSNLLMEAMRRSKVPWW